MPEGIIIALISVAGTLLIAILGLYGAKKYNIGPSQEKLVDTLQDLVSAQGDRIQELEQKLGRIPFLENEVERLNRIVFNQIIKIQELEQALEHNKGAGN